MNKHRKIIAASGVVSVAFAFCLQNSAQAVLPGLPFLQKAPPAEAPNLPGNAASALDRENAETRVEREAASPIRDNQREPGRSEPRNAPRENPRDGQRDGQKDQFREPSRELPRDNSRDTQRDPQDATREIPREAPKELPQPVQPKPPAPPSEPLPRSHDRPWIDARPDLPL